MENLLETALLWHEFAKSNGARFDTLKKANDALLFTIKNGGKSFAIPSKLEGVSQYQQAIRRIQKEPKVRFQPLSLYLDVVQNVINCYYKGSVLIGQVQKKHLRWITPLLSTSAFSCYLLEITGQEGYRYAGLNVVFTRIADAIEEAHLLEQYYDILAQDYPSPLVSEPQYI